MNRALLISALLFATTLDAETLVVAYNGFSVTIQTSSIDEAEPSTKTKYKADRICKGGGRTRTEYASTKLIPDTYLAEHLFLCFN